MFFITLPAWANQKKFFIKEKTFLNRDAHAGYCCDIVDILTCYGSDIVDTPTCDDGMCKSRLTLSEFGDTTRTI